MPATKTIEIDAGAYQRTGRVRRHCGLFSDTLRRVIWDPAAFTAAVEAAGSTPLGDKAIAAVE